MTSPRHAESTALGRYYTRPGTGEQLISVTNVLSVSCAKPALVPWAAKVCAEWSIEHLGRLFKTARISPDDAIREIKAQVTVARDHAADLGSAVHHAAERKALGVEPLFTGEYAEYEQAAMPFVEQLLQFWADFGIDVEQHIEATEMTVAHPALGYAGTLDVLMWLPLEQDHDGKVHATADGERRLWLIDYKSSATRAATSVYGEYALQLAGLRWATEMWLPNDTVEEFKLPIAGTAVLNLRAKKYELVPLPTWKAEKEAFLACLTHAKWAHTTGHDITRGEYRPVTPAGRAKPKRTRKTTTSTKAA